MVQLHAGLVRPLPETVVVGKGTSFIVEGWVFHPTARVSRLEVRLLTACPAAGPP